MRTEPAVKRAFAFFDGQNLFYAAKEAFGYPFPNYDPRLLTERVCAAQGWQIAGIHFYFMGTRGVQTFSRALRYRNQTVALPDGSLTVTLVGQEKGVDVRIALDIVRFALEAKYDVAISVLQNRWVKCACAFPVSPTVPKTRGINGTDWIRIDRSTCDACVDPNDYRPKKSTP
jgi:hypothetical protein